MKYFNVNIAQAVIFFLIIWGTQNLIHAEKSVSFEQHVQVQQELSELIANYVATNLPEMINFKMYSVYTKAPKKGLMEAFFVYSFDTPVAGTGQLATTQLAGVATLRKIQEQPTLEWALEKIEIEGETLTFSEPLVIHANSIQENSEFEEVQPVQEAKETPAPAAPKPVPVKPAPSTPTPPPTPAPTNTPEPTAPTVAPETTTPATPAETAPATQPTSPESPTTENPAEVNQ